MATCSAASSRIWKEEPHGGAAVWRDRDPGVKPSRWTHILDMMSGANPRRRDWTEED